MAQLYELSDSELMSKFLDNKSKEEIFKLEQDLIKAEFEKRLTARNEKEFKCDAGIARIICQSKKQFNQTKAKDYLSEEQITACTELKEAKFVTIMSADAVAKQRMARKMNDNDKSSV